MRITGNCLPSTQTMLQLLLPCARITYAFLVSMPPVLTAFFLQDHGKNSFSDLSREHIGVGALFAMCSLISNIPSAYLFPAKFYDKLVKLYRRKSLYTEMASFGLAIMPAAFAAFLGRNLVHVGLSGAPIWVSYVVLGPTILHTFCTRWYGTAALLDAGFEMVRWLYDGDVKTLAQFKRDFTAQGCADDIVLGESRTPDLPQTAKKFYDRLQNKKATRDYASGAVLFCLQAACVMYTFGLLPTFVHMVHKGLPDALDGILWSLIGGMTHMAFYLRMAWDFIPQCMLYITTLKDRITILQDGVKRDSSYSRLSIFMLLCAILLCTGLSGTGLMNVALHQVFDHVVKDSLLSPSAYARYWHFLIQPILGVLAAVGAGIFCNGTGFIMLLLKYFHKKDGESKNSVTVNSVLEQLNRTASRDEINDIREAQKNWVPKTWMPSCFSLFSKGESSDERTALLSKQGFSTNTS